jgi:branched-chain amino acid transport system permease protein
MTFYTINLLIYAAVDAMACLGLSQQFGIGGVTNFGFIIFQAAGGYAAAILAMPPQTANGGFQTYIGGWNLPFPIPWIGAALVGGLIALPFTFLVGRRLRGDFAAVGLLVTAVLLNLVVTNYRPVLNGDAGLSLIPQPLQARYNPATASYQWVFAGVAIVLCLGVYLFVRRITESPYGRSLRAMRDNDLVADSLGKSLLSMRTVMLVAGGAIAGLSGGVLVSYITTWSPAAWGYAETVVLFAAVIIGGAGNHVGAVLGAILVPVGFEEVTRFIPTSNNLPPNLIPSLEWVAIGLLIVIFLWVRPQGILPERKRVIRAGPVAEDGAPGGGGPGGWPAYSRAGTVVPEAREGTGDDGERYAPGSPHPPSPAVAAPSVAASPDAGSQSSASHPPSSSAAAPLAATSLDAGGEPAPPDAVGPLAGRTARRPASGSFGAGGQRRRAAQCPQPLLLAGGRAAGARGRGGAGGGGGLAGVRGSAGG